MRPLKTVPPSPQVTAYIEDLKRVIGRHESLTALEMLAGASQLVGMLVALQDQTKVTPEEAIRVVEANLEEGNLQGVRAAVPPGKRH